MSQTPLKIASLFSGAGGLDLGFQQAGYDIVWSNEFDKTVWPTHKLNFPNCQLDPRSIVEVQPQDIPQVDGIIGGPPCQSWSEAGARRGIKDARGQLFLEYIRLLKTKQPTFFLAENVAGILHSHNREALQYILELFSEANYNVHYKLLNANDYNTPQDRKRIIIIGIKKTLNKTFQFPSPIPDKKHLKDCIFDLKDNAVPALYKNKTNPHTKVLNHEYMIGGFSSIYLSRNRVREWNEPSFTIQAGGRHAPLHPSAPKMVKIDTDRFIFKPGFEDMYRRLSIRECARIQTFPDNFEFLYDSLSDGYKMIGNAVPVEFSRVLAESIKAQIFQGEKKAVNK